MDDHESQRPVVTGLIFLLLLLEYAFAPAPVRKGLLAAPAAGCREECRAGTGEMPLEGNLEASLDSGDAAGNPDSSEVCSSRNDMSLLFRGRRVDSLGGNRALLLFMAAAATAQLDVK